MRLPLVKPFLLLLHYHYPSDYDDADDDDYYCYSAVSRNRVQAYLLRATGHEVSRAIYWPLAGCRGPQRKGLKPLQIPSASCLISLTSIAESNFSK